MAASSNGQESGFSTRQSEFDSPCRHTPWWSSGLDNGLSSHECEFDPRPGYFFGMWRSLVVRLLGVQEVVGSNPITLTLILGMYRSVPRDFTGMSTCPRLRPGERAYRGIAQSGRALASGARGRRFEPAYPDFTGVSSNGRTGAR